LTVAFTRPAWVEIDLDAITRNAGSLARLCAPAALCAVVKADGYGHGAVEVARAALDGGATSLAVALVEEGVELREAGIGTDILVLSDPPREACSGALGRELIPTVSASSTLFDILQALPRGARPRVHMKVDTGMHRMGCAPDDALSLARAISAAGLHLDGLWTHLASADDPDQDGLTASQLDQLGAVDRELRAAGSPPRLVHAANSAGAIHHPRSRLDVVRCGIAIFGYAPSPRRPRPLDFDLIPALSLKARVTALHDVPPGDGVSYGWNWRAPVAARVATIPIGYADGVPRGLGDTSGEVLIRAKRRPLAGTVTMDQLMVAVDDDVQVGDEVVLIGAQEAERVTADDWARLTGTISYEILARLGPRLPRRYVQHGRP